MLANDEGAGMVRKYRVIEIIDNITALYVFIMTFAVSFILSFAQSNDTDLSGKNLFMFLCGFWGSIMCIIIRYGFLYHKAITLNYGIKKLFMLVYLTVGSSISVLILIGVLYLNGFAIRHEVLSYYNAYQIYMIGVLLSQWLGEKIFT